MDPLKSPDTFPLDVRKTFNSLWHHVCLLHSECIHFAALFNRPISDIGKQCVGIDALALLQQVFGENIVVAISRLTDPAKQGTFENVSLAKLMAELEGHWPDANEAKKAKTQIAEVDGFADYWRRLRNKLIAHWDSNEPLTLQPITVADITAMDDATASIARLMNTIERNFMSGETNYRDQAFHASAAKLVTSLGLPVRPVLSFGG
jgi:AbiU2